MDILINNAGISSRGAVLDTHINVDRKIMETNFFGTIALTKGTSYTPSPLYLSTSLPLSFFPILPLALLPTMLQHGGGHIVVISSLQGKIGIPYRSSCNTHTHTDR